MSRSFAGTDTCLRIVSNIADASTVSTVQVSFSAWVKRSRTSHTEEEVVMITGVQNSSNNHLALLINTDNTVIARTRSAANSQAVSAGTITDTDTWHLLVAVFGNTSTGAASIASRHIYLDNSVDNNTDSRGIGTASSVFCVGSDTDTTGALSREFGGLIAYPTLWVGVALTAANVASLWNSGAGADPLTVASPTNHWDLTGNESPEVDDVGTADLTVVGATFSTDDPFTLGGAAGQPTITRFGGIPGMRIGGPIFGRGW